MLQALNSQSLNHAPGPKLSISKPWTVVLLEGSWQQAKKMETMLPPSLPRVRLNDGEEGGGWQPSNLVSPLRKQVMSAHSFARSL